jgi:hypothetical protein
VPTGRATPVFDLFSLRRHAPPSPLSLSSVPVDSLRSVGLQGQPFSWQLAHAGEDWQWSNVAPGNVSAKVLYDGSLIVCANMPLALVIGGVRLQWSAFAPALHVTEAQFPVSLDVYNQIPYGASVSLGAEVLGAPNRPPALLLDGQRLWPVGCISLITDNGSNITFITDAEWDSYETGQSLFCLHP